MRKTFFVLSETQCNGDNLEALQTEINWATLIEHITENRALIRGRQVLHSRIKAPDCST